MKKLLILGLFTFVLVLTGCTTSTPVEDRAEDTTESQFAYPEDTSITYETLEPAAENTVVTMKTNFGDIKIELFTDKMPITAGNFLELAQEDFYDGVIFHRVIYGFMIQGGDPDGTGAGGPGYTIEDEFKTDYDYSNVRGTLSMANTGQPNSGGSQFFINVVDNLSLDHDKQPLTSKHPVFGRVIDGMKVVDDISRLQTNMQDRPATEVVIEDIVIE